MVNIFQTFSLMRKIFCFLFSTETNYLFCAGFNVEQNKFVLFFCYFVQHGNKTTILLNTKTNLFKVSLCSRFLFTLQKTIVYCSFSDFRQNGNLEQIFCSGIGFHCLFSHPTGSVGASSDLQQNALFYCCFWEGNGGNAT